MSHLLCNIKEGRGEFARTKVSRTNCGTVVQSIPHFRLSSIPSVCPPNSWKVCSIPVEQAQMMKGHVEGMTKHVKVARAHHAHGLTERPGLRAKLPRLPLSQAQMTSWEMLRRLLLKLFRLMLRQLWRQPKKRWLPPALHT